jgi:thymidylate synthase (FAD)
MQQVLDHGYVTLIETWGSDERIIEAARMSTNKGFQGWGGEHKPHCHAETFKYPCDCPLDTVGDEKLLKFLWDNNHHTPFEMAGLTFEVQAPIFVFREWHRHRTQSYNELSARYTPIPNQHYMPDVARVIAVDPLKNKQASSLDDAAELTLDEALEWLAELQNLYEQSEHCYQSGLRRGVPKEIARLATLVSRYSRMRASGNLRNWLHFASLRTGRGAQREIQDYAQAVCKAIEAHFPRTYQLWRG